MEIRLCATKQQQEVLKDYKSKIKVVIAGRRYGKSIGVLRNEIIQNCLGRPNFKFMVVVPSYAQVKGEFNDLIGNSELHSFIKRNPIQPYPHIVFLNGSQVAFRSLDRPNLIRSGGWHYVWADEIQDIDEDTWNRVLRPLTGDKRGRMGASGQFNGTEGWVYKKLYLPGQKAGSKIRSWRFSSEDGLAFQGKEGQEELQFYKDTLPKVVYEQEFLCLPAANQRAVFRPEDIELCKHGDLKQNPTQGCRYSFALDLGKVVDPNSYVVLEVAPSGEVTVIESGVRPLKEKHEYGAVEMAKVVRRFGNCCAIVDSTGGATGGHHNIDEFVKFYRGQIPSLREFYYNLQSKAAVVTNLSLFIEQHRVNIPAANEELLRQLSIYEYEYSKNGVYHYNAPKGQHDDLVSALGMALYAVQKSWLHQAYGGNVNNLVGMI